MANANNFFRTNIDEMLGYSPGEQPQHERLLKLNTNENPYPPSPKVFEALAAVEPIQLIRYPDPVANKLRDAVASINHVTRDQVIIGNGSDDILTMVTRAFTDSTREAACLEPSYSLYHVLTNIQDSQMKKIELGENFELPSNILSQLDGVKLFYFTCPNAPIGNRFDKQKIREICKAFSGVVLIDEAYTDFAEDNCIDLVNEFPNVIVSRSLSKSYSLAGARVGYGIASKNLIDGLMKVKDSYNVNVLSQVVATEAILDQAYFKECCDKVIQTRTNFKHELIKRGFEVLPSETNFLFAAPPCDAKKLYDSLRNEGIIVRHFPNQRTAKYIRITIGTDEEMNYFLTTMDPLIEDIK